MFLLKTQYILKLAFFKDQVEHLLKINIVADSINSTMSDKERNRVCKDLTSECPITQLLYITAEQAATSKFQVRKINLLYF